MNSEPLAVINYFLFEDTSNRKYFMNTLSTATKKKIMLPVHKELLNDMYRQYCGKQ